MCAWIDCWNILMVMPSLPLKQKTPCPHKGYVSRTSFPLADFASSPVVSRRTNTEERRRGRAVANEGEICEGLPVSGVLWHYRRAPRGPDSLWLGTLGTEATFKHGHYGTLKVQILLLHAIRVWHPGALTLGRRGGRGGRGNCTPD